MNDLTPIAAHAANQLSMGETILFWVCAPLIVVAAAGVLLAKKPVHAAVSMIFVMIPLAVIYFAQEASFVGAVQVIVYTGAVMMLFLFVIMLVGVGATETRRERIRGQLPAAVLAGLGTVILLVTLVVRGMSGAQARGLELANSETNPVGLAKLLFGSHVGAMELTGALLIVAALGAMTLTHKHRHGPKADLAATAAAKMKAFAEKGTHIGQLPTPGVYASTNAATAPAFGAGGKTIEASVPRVLRVRGQAQSLAEVAPAVVATVAQGGSTHGAQASRGVGLSGGIGMPGREKAPEIAPRPTGGLLGGAFAAPAAQLDAAAPSEPAGETSATPTTEKEGE
ncbi:NADH-quinone oxidoreductase subunit J [Buchananella felis]|uniref:NADH-quinone oxidoreductase subunit J n=1 Tax=Buchananella felis TaxID=3231492 RepID=UPI003527EDCE